MGEGRTPHPRDTMDDVTEVSSAKSIEKKNTVMLTRKGVEARSKTVIMVIIGAFVGVAFFLLFQPLLGTTVSVFFIVLFPAAMPFLFVGTVRDGTEQVRWKRYVNRTKSKEIVGQIFFPNSTEAENVTETEMVVFKA